MKKKHLILVLLFLIIVTFGLSAQQYTAPKLKQNNAGNQKASARVSAITDPINQFKAPEIIPPSPDVSSLGKFGEIPVGLYSGIPSIDVPIYTISAKNINVPIGISYHAGGIRVEEIASQIGLGFALQAGGTITRTVLGRADDKVGGFLYKNTPYSPEYLQNLHSTVPNSSYAVVNPAVSNPIRNKWDVYDALLKYYDSQPDIYQYSFLGRSGKFTIDRNNRTVGIPIPYVPLKITIQYDASNQENESGTTVENPPSSNPYYGTMIGFTIIDENGTKYIFNDKDQTQIINIDPRRPTTYQSFYSAWQLTKVIPESGSIIDFTYDNYGQYYRRWVAQDRKIKDIYSCPTITDSYGLAVDDNFIQRTQTQTSIVGKRIKEIKWDNGKVVFTPEVNNRQDILDKALSQISVYDINNNKVKEMKLYHSYFNEFTDDEYTFFNTANSIYSQPNLGRLRLDSLQQVSGSVNFPPYVFKYESGDLPHRYSTQVDHWGYYNGANTNTSLHPKVFVGNQIIGNANRHTNINYSKIGTLKEIKYPTGGRTEFIFESHDTWAKDWEVGAGYREAPLAGNNDVIYHTISTGNYIKYINNFPHPNQQTITVPTNGRSFKISSIVNNDNIDLVRLYIYQSTTMIINVPLEAGSEFFLQGGNYQVFLAIADIGTGNVPLTSSIQTNLSGSEIVGATTNNFYNKPVGGLRVFKIIDYTSNNGIASTKQFSYRQESNSSQSSGRLIQTPLYAYKKTEEKLSYSLVSGSSVPNILYTCDDIYLTATSTAPLTQTKGAYIGYDYVEVFQDQDGANGKVAHYFTSPIDYPDEVDISYPFAPNTDFDWKRGYERQVKQYKKKSNGIYSLTKVITNIENIEPVYTNQLAIIPSCDFYGVRYRFENDYTFGCKYPNFKSYTISSGWMNTKQTTETTYNSAD